MSSHTISKKIEKLLPNKKTFIAFFILMLCLTFGSVIALANENTVVVKTDGLNVRLGPGLAHEVMTQVEANERLFLLGEENKWYKVRLKDDQIGWVASWLVDTGEMAQGDTQFARVTGEEVNIRQFSNTEADILGTVYKETELQVLYQEDEWFQILYMGRAAWIHGDYIELIDAPSIEEIAADSPEPAKSEAALVEMGDVPTNIRKIPSAEGELIYKAQPGEQFEWIDSTDEWHHIRIDENTTGYVANWVSNLVSQPKETAAKLPPAETDAAQYARTVSSLAEATIVIDAGHGGYDPGAISPDQTVTEKNVTLSTALLLQKRLQDAGSNVLLTRRDDESVSLDNRVQLAHAHQADVFISLHYDAVEQANTMSGTTTYYYTDSNRELAETINRYLAHQTPLPNNGIRLGDYYVLRTNRQPSLLLELGYMNSEADLQYIDAPSYQATVVEAIYQGLREYYGQ